MKLKKLILSNYRCFSGETEIKLDNFSTFIGSNSSGKSTILSALSKLFSESPHERTILIGDFYKPLSQKGEVKTSQTLFIEAQFEFNTSMEDIPIFFEQVTVDAEGEPPVLRIRLTATLEENGVNPTIDQHLSYITCPEDEDTTKEKNRNVKAHHLKAIRFIYIPALRDPSAHLRQSSGSMLYRLFSSIRWTDSTKENIETAVENINQAFSSEIGTKLIDDAVGQQWKKYDSDPRYTLAELLYSGKDISSISKAMEILFSPTPEKRKYSVHELGDGLRSLFYFSLIDSILTIEEKISQKEDGAETAFGYIPPLLTIIAVEEPENNIAPHLLGKLIANLETISGKDSAQVLMTSHSPAAIMRISPDQLKYCRMQNDGSTSIREIILPSSEDDAYKYVKEAVKAYPELYFAKLVILGEGDSEELILKKCFEVSDFPHDISGISVVPLGGRHVNHFWKLLKGLEIPHITLLDLDKERYQGGWGRIHYAHQELLNNGYDRDKILNTDDGVMTDDEFEELKNRSQTEDMQRWIKFLEGYNVYFSSPLDIDFLMLTTFEKEYKSIIAGKEGPEITVNNRKSKVLKLTEEEKESTEYEDKVSTSLKHTLKDKGGDGSTYTGKEKELMIFYDYFFLGRGKPTTHLLAFSQLEDKTLKANMPEVLHKIITKAHKIIFSNEAETNE